MHKDVFGLGQLSNQWTVMVRSPAHDLGGANAFVAAAATCVPPAHAHAEPPKKRLKNLLPVSFFLKKTRSSDK